MFPPLLSIRPLPLAVSVLRIYGWSVWEWPKVFIEAKFHAVWKQPDGSFLDIAPKSLPIPRVLFIPDPRRVYLGSPAQNSIGADTPRSEA